MSKSVDKITGAKKVDGSDYCNAVVEAIGAVLGPDGKTEIDFRDLFYPVNIADGSYAIKSYNEVMAYAGSSKSIITTREVVTSTRDNLREVLKKYNINDVSAPSQTGESKIDDYYSRKQMIGSVAAKISKIRRLADARKTSDFEPSDEQKKLIATVSKRLTNMAGVSSQGDSREKTAAEEANTDAEKSDITTVIMSDDTVTADSVIKDDPVQREAEFSFEEPIAELAGHIIFSHKEQSRTLLLASAGHGKTTLLKRIMLYYSQRFCGCFKNDDADRALEKKYFLPDENYVPFLIKLREISSGEQKYDIERLIIESVLFYIRNHKDYSSHSEAELQQSIGEWFGKLKEKNETLLLLIDGLDEISDDNKNVFLKSLEKYLENHRGTRVVLSTRVAGVKNNTALRSFSKMEFCARSILPFTLDETKCYAHNWIDTTQAEDKRERYKNSLEQIFTNAKFLFLKNSMRSPLEVVIILKQLVSNNLSLSRYQIFRDMLWEYLTSHESYEVKNAIYEDRMTILSFLAYKMQLNDTLLASEKDIEAYFSETESLSFHTDIVKNENVSGSVMAFLDLLASNAGIIETQKFPDSETGQEQTKYTFPIRAFQEFLCAYACCHLRFEKQRLPEPVSILQKHIHDKKWSDIISFSLSDLKNNNKNQYDELVDILIQELEDNDEELQYFKSLLETEMIINKEQAGQIAEKYFSGIGLIKKKKEILDICMEYESAYAIIYSLRSKCRESWANGQDNYFEAYARATVLWELKVNSPIIPQAEKLLRSSNGYLNKVGALVPVIACEMAFEENDIRYEGIFDGEEIPEDFCDILAEKYNEHKDVAFIQALSSVWLTGLDGSEQAGKLLFKNKEFAFDIRKVLENRIIDVYALPIKTAMENDDRLPWYKRLVYALGTYPPVRALWKPSPNKSLEEELTRAFLGAMYIAFRDNYACDVLAIILAKMNYGMISNEDFVNEIKSLVDFKENALLVNSSKNKKSRASAVKRMNKLFDAVYVLYKNEGVFDIDTYFEKIAGTVYFLISAKKYEEVFEYCKNFEQTLTASQERMLQFFKAYMLVCKKRDELLTGKADLSDKSNIKGYLDILGYLDKAFSAKHLAVFLKLYYNLICGNMSEAQAVLFGDKSNDEYIVSGDKKHQFTKTLERTLPVKSLREYTASKKVISEIAVMTRTIAANSLIFKDSSVMQKADLLPEDIAVLVDTIKDSAEISAMAEQLDKLLNYDDWKKLNGHMFITLLLDSRNPLKAIHGALEMLLYIKDCVIKGEDCNFFDVFERISLSIKTILAQYIKNETEAPETISAFKKLLDDEDIPEMQRAMWKKLSCL